MLLITFSSFESPLSIIHFFDKNRIFCKFPAHFYLCNQLIFSF
ncbi:hypothetical protein ROSEINA2194_03411 [Roseburia inulinivorans DSM 16841]|uniref:Uncharacterized protein n=1 Tax=Roseburia inulinivorans DSM 16841 TaxID=622312 RepID=C0FXD2_9FIRM|nr:hypothetical protein ROSEINA2194_03411 [Roseburia inulinivorans DSM 16841]